MKKFPSRNLRDAAAVGISVLLVAGAVCTIGAGMGHNPIPHQTWKEHYAVVMPGETLWQKCQKYAGDEDVRVLIDRVRRDNDIADPGKLQPGTRLVIRTKG